MNTQEATALTVKKAWNIECPKCHTDDRIDITMSVNVRLLPSGIDTTDADGYGGWNATNTAACFCGYVGTVAAFGFIDTAAAFQIVIDLARQNVADQPDGYKHHRREMQAINMIEDLATNEYGAD